LVSRFVAETASWLDIGTPEVNLCIVSDDAFDAVISALVARATSVALVDPISSGDHSSAIREGWIAVPSIGSLELLAQM
jgi:hypothetical protein